MENKNNTDQELLSGLKSSDTNKVAETLQELRIRGTVHLLPEVFALLFSKKMENLKNDIAELINDIKDPLAVPVYMEALEDYRGKKGFELLVSACWQCGLDFSPYIDKFIDLVFEEDYYVSIEAFSVIEENVSLLNSQQKSARLEFIRAKLEFLSPEKRLLVNELMSLLSIASGPFRIDPDYVN